MIKLEKVKKEDIPHEAKCELCGDKLGDVAFKILPLEPDDSVEIPLICEECSKPVPRVPPEMTPEYWLKEESTPLPHGMGLRDEYGGI